MRSFALLSLVSAAAAQYKGFNYGATAPDGSVRAQADFEDLFKAAKSLTGASGFTSARLYTMIQGDTTNTPTSAIQAAIDTETTLLLGLWGSAGQSDFDNEVAALKTAISQYGTSFTDLIAGISVGSEDLYRDSPTGIENDSGAGATPDELTSYISQVRSAISGTAASAAKVGHVDTWTAWVNGSNAAVITAVDWLGVDSYPYFQTTDANSIDNGASLFFESYNNTVDVAGGKPVWITETGWPVSGPTENQAVPSVANAKTYWQDVACRVVGDINTWWYTLYDPEASGTASFGLQSDLGGAPYFDLTCSASSSAASSSSAAPTTSATSSSSAAPTSAASSSAAPSSAASSSAAATSVASSSAAATTSDALSTAASTSVTSPTATAETYTGAGTTVSSAVSAPNSVVTSNIGTAETSVAGGSTSTIHMTTLVTITSCPSSCTESAAPTTASGKSCPTNLSGTYEYPHLIVPVNSASPDTAYGTSYDGQITPTISTIFDFDIPASDAGKTCSLVFLFPEQSQLETSSFTFNGEGGIKVTELSSPATTSTTFNNIPAAGSFSSEISSVAPGNSYLVTSQDCAAGERVAFEFSSTGGLDLTYFQDYNPSPIGAYITVC